MEDKIQKEKKETTSVRRRALSGVVVSNTMKDTVVVEVMRYVKHPKYKKYVRRVKRYKAHDADNTKEIGDKVRIEEVRPISKEKRHRVV